MYVCIYLSTVLTLLVSFFFSEVCGAVQFVAIIAQHECIARH